MQLHLKSVRFKRSANTPLEAGIMVNEDQLIVDMLGNPVLPPLWYFVDDHELRITYKPGEFREKRSPK